MTFGGPIWQKVIQVRHVLLPVWVILFDIGQRRSCRGLGRSGRVPESGNICRLKALPTPLESTQVPKLPSDAAPWSSNLGCLGTWGLGLPVLRRVSHALRVLWVACTAVPKPRRSGRDLGTWSLGKSAPRGPSSREVIQVRHVPLPEPVILFGIGQRRSRRGRDTKGSSRCVPV